MRPGWDDLLLALRAPAAMAKFDADIWDLVVRQASSAGLLGRLGAIARQRDIAASVPAPVLKHLVSALTIAEQQQRAVRWELIQLTETLAETEGPVLLLKGAAYAAADLPPAAGRLFSDIDLLVPKSQVDATEAALMLGGWVSSHYSAYDQRYYRQWMHEIPPMVHMHRRTVLDLHHNLLPETARIRTRPELIVAEAMRLPEYPRFSLPSPRDLVLHSATHLFHEGEWAHGLRDLVDLDAMLREFGTRERFWDELLARAEQLNLGRPLFYGLRYCRRVLTTPVPDDVVVNCPGAPGRRAAKAMDALFVPALSSAHHSCRLSGSRAAELALYLRSHWLRMPPHLLLPHLLRKAWQERVADRFGADEKSKVDRGHSPNMP